MCSSACPKPLEERMKRLANHMAKRADDASADHDQIPGIAIACEHLLDVAAWWLSRSKQMGRMPSVCR